MAKKRLDEILLERDLVDSLKEAGARIMAGEVIVNDQRMDKAGLRFGPDVNIRIRGRRRYPYVSRGGLKLAHALEAMEIPVDGKVCLDLGSSTGGFTDCLIQSGAELVFAVDVGYGLLDWSLRDHDRVRSLERTHASKLTREDVTEEIDLLVADLSFNSLRRLIPPIRPFLKADAQAVLLIKPQFEAARHEVGDGGIITDPLIHKRVCDEVVTSIMEMGARVIGLEPSPILGTQGNQEFLLGVQFVFGAAEEST